MKRAHVMLLFLSFLPFKIVANDEAWTWLYHKFFTDQELALHEQQKVISFVKEQVPAFTQLVFSWNAVRPKQGFFSFWVQAHDATTDAWGNWHKMMEWGAGVQRSFLDNAHGATQYIHVRLEAAPNHRADAFRIKVIAHDDASLSLLKGFFISTSDFTKFKPESDDYYGQFQSVLVNNVPKKSQMAVNHEKSAVICSPTSCSMLLSYLLGQDIDPADFAENAYDAGLGAYGSWPFNTAHAFERCSGEFCFATARLNSFEHLYQRLQKGIPVVVSVRGAIPGAAKVYDKGHLLIVVGFDGDKQRVICHDPAFARDEETVKSYSLKHFLTAWERSNRLAYLAETVNR